MKLWQVLLMALLLWGPTSVVRPPVRQQELRVLVSARNMLESGNFTRPEFQNRPRFRKPPMAYWLAAGGMALTGQYQTAWAGRLLFLLSSMGGMALLVKIAGPAGLHTALIALFSFGFWYYAPLAETDMIQITGILLFFYAWQRQAGLLAGLGISFACLSKGPGGFLIPIISLIFLLRFYRPDRKFIIATLLIPLLLIGGWILFLIGETSGLDQMQKDLTATFVSTSHANPWYYYFYTLPLMMIPGLFAIFGTPQKKEQSAPPEQRTALTWLGITLVLLILTVSKQRHYALLMVPPAAWLIGMRVQSRKLPSTWVLILVSGLIGLGSAAYLMQTDEARNARFLAGARPLIQEAPTLHVVGINSAVFDYHLGRHVENTDDAHAALRRAESGDAVVIVRKNLSWEDGPLTGFTPVRSDSDDFWIRSLYIKEDPITDLDRSPSKRE